MVAGGLGGPDLSEGGSLLEARAVCQSGQHSWACMKKSLCPEDPLMFMRKVKASSGDHSVLRDVSARERSLGSTLATFQERDLECGTSGRPG